MYIAIASITSYSASYISIDIGTPTIPSKVRTWVSSYRAIIVYGVKQLIFYLPGVYIKSEKCYEVRNETKLIL